jgi:hypothetical protein
MSIHPLIILCFIAPSIPQSTPFLTIFVGFLSSVAPSIMAPPKFVPDPDFFGDPDGICGLVMAKLAGFSLGSDVSADLILIHPKASLD